ncbi:hypothetical protein HFU84_11460 [Acidithiobacillus sp. CV18-2]|uniref:Uncharacterized protein n=1 Tax=Igneacidithiobacillus copahuensis TaxID=2724909 RepID=A0AAE3CIZ6_9PROT|nr:hypothetical protein [Igneacidithiobacillus copahuensis]MBU2753275.1 hypothetical protein [Acidithiobacillus sp. CV18-3]MBU2758216.1 hypothetical protein [Acidithiobacillus sp. BN09-2]MBU2778111.1 hypothetical protein [Acidithiobacillus sp. CV18-2]MBU2797271.1 hypothetical protein [Acidithiobacillus sp. VAN18-2]MBU2798238.1 hypothetical protein [Acidithiobacillus sp. VAN18-4]UTV82048.1 hypothetical protein MQE22_05330 [Acidithiobacillus sp. YTS05]
MEKLLVRDVAAQERAWLPEISGAFDDAIETQVLGQFQTRMIARQEGGQAGGQAGDFDDDRASLDSLRKGLGLRDRLQLPAIPKGNLSLLPSYPSHPIQGLFPPIPPSDRGITRFADSQIPKDVTDATQRKIKALSTTPSA